MKRSFSFRGDRICALFALLMGCSASADSVDGLGATSSDIKAQTKKDGCTQETARCKRNGHQGFCRLNNKGDTLYCEVNPIPVAKGTAKKDGCQFESQGCTRDSKLGACRLNNKGDILYCETNPF